MPKEWSRHDLTVVRVDGTRCIQLKETLTSTELRLIRQIDEVFNIRDERFIELASPPESVKRKWRQQNPYDFANSVAERINRLIIGSRIKKWVDDKLGKPCN
jgi:hypothetical protein